MCEQTNSATAVLSQCIRNRAIPFLLGRRPPPQSPLQFWTRAPQRAEISLRLRLSGGPPQAGQGSGTSGRATGAGRELTRSPPGSSIRESRGGRRDLLRPLDPGVDVERVGELGGDGITIGEERLERVVHHPAIA